MSAPVVSVRFTGGRLRGHVVEHRLVSVAARELRTRDDEGHTWRWLVPLGLCKDSPHAVLVDPVGAMKAASDAGLSTAGHAPMPSERQEGLWSGPDTGVPW